jgi:hypothetical protein
MNKRILAMLVSVSMIASALAFSAIPGNMQGRESVETVPVPGGALPPETTGEPGTANEPGIGEPRTVSTYDYVIITTNDIVANSERLGNFVHLKELYGHSVLIVTETDFDSITGPPPNGRAERIKQWLIDNDGPLGIDYVLLIGDPDPDNPIDPADSVGDIPMKTTMPNYFSWTYEDMPTDMFYADLGGDWDLDGDGYYAEGLSSTNPESPDPVINTDYFSARWTGLVQCDFDEEYNFHTFTDGGVRLWIDGDLVIDDWDDLTEHPRTSDQQTKDMTAGDHDIVVEYKEHTGDGIMQLMWMTTAAEGDPTFLDRQIIPLDHLRDETNTADGLTGRFYNNVDMSGTPDLVRLNGEELNYNWGTGDIGPGGPENDADVYVGRIPVYDGDYAQLDYILGKMIQYETDPGDISWRESILLPVYPLADNTPAYQYPEAVLSDYAIAAGFSYYRIYKEDYAPVGGPTPELWPTSADNVQNEWQNGYGVVTWWTHGSPTGASSVFSSDRTGALDDTKPAFTYQASCTNAHPETHDNLAYALLKHGAIAAVGATRVSIGSRGDWTYNPASAANPNFGYAYNRGIIQDGWPSGKSLVEAKKPTGDVSWNELNYNLYGDPETYLLTTVPNYPPVASVAGPIVINEGETAFFDASASSDPEGDALEYRWDLDNDGTWDVPWSSDPTTSLIFGDDHIGHAKVEVRDQLGFTDSETVDVTVLNIDPAITHMEAYILVNFSLRAAGEKWHNVQMYVREGGIDIAYAEVVRYPGSPDDQMVKLGEVKCDVTKTLEVYVLYTPADDPINGQPNGATPVWVNISFEDGGYVLLQHNFNVKHPERWEWNIGVNQYLVGHGITFESEGSDPGSDDLTFTWNWDDGSPDGAATYYNDGIGPDPYPSTGGTFPFSAADSATHAFMSAGTYNVKLSLSDDDGGATELMMVIALV